MGDQGSVFATNRVAWSEQDANYTTRYVGKVGRWTLFSYSWGGTIRNDPQPWRLRTFLPVKMPREKFEGHDEARTYAEAILRSWVRDLGAVWPEGESVSAEGKERSDP